MKTSRRKKIWITAGVLILAFAGVYWYIHAERFADTATKKPDYTVDAMEFIKEFESDHKIANAKYTEKIVAVNGIVSATESADTTINIKMIDSTSGSYIIFAFQDQHLDEAKSLQAGDAVSIKGSCSGGVYSKILGSHFISFKRSAIHKQ